MIVETKVEGEPNTVTAAADWMRGFWQQALTDCATYAGIARRMVGVDWDGQASDAYESVASSVVRAADDEADRAGKAATLLDEMAFRMTQREQQMADLRDFASSNGLTVMDTRVAYEATAAPGAPTTEEHAAQVEHDVQMRALLAELQETVDLVNTQFREWVEANVGAAAEWQRAHADMASASDFGLNLAKSAVAATSRRVETVVEIGDLAFKTVKGDIGLDDLASAVTTEGLEAIAGTSPVGIVSTVVGSAVIETSFDSGDDPSGRDPLAPSDAERAAEPQVVGPRPIFIP